MIWGTTNTTIFLNVKELQIFAGNVVDGKAKKYDHVTLILKELNWLNVKDQIIQDTGFTMFKYLTNLYSDHLLTFPAVRDITDSSTRQKDHLYIPTTNTDLRARFLSVTGPTLWNRLPSIVKPSFKTKLKIELLDKNIF